jgi:exonuclease SbcD
LKILGSADWHLGLARYGQPGPDGVGSRVRDFEQTLQRFVQTARHEGVDMAVFAGDTFHTRHEGPHERAAVADALAALREDDITVVIVPGNHDGRATVGGADSDALRWLHALAMPGVHVFLEPAASVLVVRGTPVAIVAMPYPHRRMLAGGAIERQIGELDASISWRAEWMPHIFVGHLTVADSVAGSETAMQMGWDVAIRRAVLDPFDLAILGHIHRFQRLGKVQAWYCGSPEYVDFTEAGLDKGFLLADIEANKKLSVRLVPSEPRPMFDLDVLMDNATDGWAEEIVATSVWRRGPIVRLRITSARRPAAERIAALERSVMERGASFVKTVITLPEIAPIDRRDAERGPDPELDLMAATRRHLTAAGFPRVDAAMDAARKLVPA